MKSNVKPYKDNELLERVCELPSYRGIPEEFWCLWVRSNEDAFNKFDDKMYLFKGDEFQSVYLVTTNAGKTGLLNFEKYNSAGVAVLKADTIVYNSHKRGMHRGKVLAYRQEKSIPYFRDNDKDEKAEEIGEEKSGVIYANIHPATYQKGSDVEKEFINGWSLACLVFAKGTDFEDFMKRTEGQTNLTNCILKEF